MHQKRVIEITLDRKEHRLVRNGEEVHLRRKPFAMLSYLVDNKGVLLTFQQILDNVWPDTVVSRNSIKDYVAEIRKVLNDNAASPSCIQTVRGVGYRYLGGITVDTSDRQVYGLISNVTPIVGRGEELKSLYSTILDSGCRLLSLTGPGGIGKTRLALALGNMLSESTSVAFVKLGHAKTSESTIEAIADCLKISMKNQVPDIDMLVSSLTDRDMILILDNLSTETQCLNVTKSLLEYFPLIKVVVTSRAECGLYGEWLYNVSGLPTGMSDQTALSALTGIPDAIKLFIQCAKRANPTFEVNSSDVVDLNGICEILRGIPLAIEIAAPWMKTLSPNELLTALNVDKSLLENPQPIDGYGNLSLLTLMRQHWDSLTLIEKTTLGVASLFRGHCSESALLEIAQTSKYTINDLVKKSMLVQLKNDRVDMHDVMRSYAREWMRNQDDCTQYQKGFIRFIVKLVETADYEFLTSRQFYWINLLEIEMQNIREALEYCLSDTSDTRFATSSEGLTIVGDLALFWFTANHWREGIRYTRLMLEAGRDQPAEIRSRAELTLGGLLALSDDLEEAETCLNRSANVFCNGPAKQKARTFIAQAVVYRLQGRFTESISACKNSLEVYARYPDDGSVLIALDCMGQSYMAQRKYELAIETFEHGLTIGEQVGLTTSLPHTLINLARSYRANNDYEKARKIVKKCLQVARDMDIKIYVGQALLCCAWIQIDDHRFNTATHILSEAKDIFLFLGDQTGVAECMDALAVLSEKSSDLESAAQLFYASKKMRNEMGCQSPTDYRSLVEASFNRVHNSLSSQRLLQHRALGCSLTPQLLIKKQLYRLGYGSECARQTEHVSSKIPEQVRCLAASSDYS